MMALGQGVIGRVPVTHAISLVGALMFLHTEPYVGADTLCSTQPSCGKI